MQAAQCDLRGHHSGLALLSALLKEAKSEIVSDGQISERIAKKIFYAFCLWDYFFAAACLYSITTRAKWQTNHLKRSWTNKLIKSAPFSSLPLTNGWRGIAYFERSATERQHLAVEAEARSFSLPPVDATDKLLRYEAHLDRQLYRAMD